MRSNPDDPTRTASVTRDRRADGRRVEIALPARFDFPWVLRFLAARTVPALESAENGVYTRSVRVNGNPVTLSLRESTRDSPNVVSRRHRILVATAEPRLRPALLTSMVTRMLDLDANLEAFRRVARRDPILSTVIGRRSGIRLPQLPDAFEGLLRGILGQQVSVAGASTMTDRLVRLFAPAASGADGGGFVPFPTPGDVADAGADRLRTIGLTRAKAATIAAVSTRIASGVLDLEALRTMAADDAQALLERLPGIGPWTASYVRMRALGDRDAFPAADLGVIKALAAAGVDRRSIVGVAERWRPWRAYATLHLWESLGARR